MSSHNNVALDHLSFSNSQQSAPMKACGSMTWPTPLRKHYCGGNVSWYQSLLSTVSKSTGSLIVVVSGGAINLHQPQRNGRPAPRYSRGLVGGRESIPPTLPSSTHGSCVDGQQGACLPHSCNHQQMTGTIIV
ncbi:hypothetical protein E2C01_081455 [Portunus trituberculatus]|uniref:Uncharacterized protein n=1 Tax=Portunus trituberculatus TaxID=210409 RepID=A0A5B7IPU9_PORTR|nr:hypothetical protein [Portunus trituberculatus]